MLKRVIWCKITSNVFKTSNGEHVMTEEGDRKNPDRINVVP